MARSPASEHHRRGLGQSTRGVGGSGATAHERRSGVARVSRPPGWTRSKQILPDITYCSDGLLMGMAGPVCVAIWQEKLTLERLEVNRTHLTAAVRKDPGNVAYLCVIESGSEPADDSERKALSALLDAFGSNLKCVAFVVLDTGFRAAITRTVLSTVHSLIESPLPRKHVETTWQAANWLNVYVDIGSVTTFLMHVQTMRETLRKNAERARMIASP